MDTLNINDLSDMHLMMGFLIYPFLSSVYWTVDPYLYIT